MQGMVWWIVIGLWCCYNGQDFVFAVGWIAAIDAAYASACVGRIGVDVTSVDMFLHVLEVPLYVLEVVLSLKITLSLATLLIHFLCFPMRKIHSHHQWSVYTVLRRTFSDLHVMLLCFAIWIFFFILAMERSLFCS